MRAGRHADKGADAPPIFCIGYVGGSGVHYEYVQCNKKARAVTYAIKECKALGVPVFTVDRIELPKVLNSNESFKILEND